MSAIRTRALTGRLLRVTAVAAAMLLGSVVQAAAPGITGTAGTNGPVFNLNAEPALITQPDGASVYSWGYGCAATFAPGFVPASIGTAQGASCPTMQIPGPTMVVTQGQTVTVTLTNNLPPQAGNTSILFPGFVVTATGGSPGLLAQEAANGATVTYQFVASTPGTHSYYSGTQQDLQIEMGLYGVIIVLPSTIPAACQASANRPTDLARAANGEADFRLADAAFDNNDACYDREYLFQFSEMDPKIHRAAEEVVNCTGGACPADMSTVATEPYLPGYYLINGRSMPDDMDPNYSVQYPHQPYNGNPHMHPGDLTLVRVVGQGRWQHPFHEHANHLRVLARDGNLELAPGTVDETTPLAGPLMFTTTTTPGQTIDALFQWTGKGLNWDVYGHGMKNGVAVTADVCVPDAYGYYTSVPAAPNFYEWCADHNKALEKAPFGNVGAGGPVSLPDPQIVANGPWYGGSPYLGPDATSRAVGATPIPPSGTVGNSPTDEAGFAYMWHSHNEREITTNNIFPGGMMMMMLIDPRAYVIDESK